MGALFIKKLHDMIGLIMTILYLSFLLLIILSAVLTAYASWIGAPFLPTPKTRIKSALKMAGLKKGDKIYDLGSATGRILIIAEKHFGANAVGLELSPFLYIFSKINLLINNTKNSKVLFKNFYCQNLFDADMVFVFLMPHTLSKLKPKFKRELHKGTKVISYAFQIKGWQPKKVLKEKGSPAVFIYEIL